MKLQFEILVIPKRVPLTISRGTVSESRCLWIQIEQEGVEGWGEAGPFSAGGPPQTLDQIQTTLQAITPRLEPYSPWQRQTLEWILQSNSVPSAVKAAIDMALYDWMGKALQQPIWTLWGLDRHQCPLTSVTIGISSPDAAQQRTLAWLDLADLRAFKVKLGSPQGIGADQAMLVAVQSCLPTDALLTVDANGGWSLQEALIMTEWLAEHGVQYVEQPLNPSCDAELPILKAHSPLPIFVDESCFDSQDLSVLASTIDGINIKLMKSGGLTEALKMIHMARGYHLQIMVGCYGHTTLANSAAAQLGPLVDYLDLDSHLNLQQDPFKGAYLDQGRLLPSAQPGLGVDWVGF